MTQSSNNSPRIPWVAMTLSFLSAGVGHIYCGRIAKGFALYSSWFIVILLLFLSSWLAPSISILVAFILTPIVAVVGIYFYAALDAYRAADKSESPYELKDYNRSGIYALLIAMQLVCPIVLMVATRALAYEAFYLPMRSMNPNFLPGDRILVNKLRLDGTTPERGDVIVFSNPDPQPGNSQTYIKRVIGLPGDEVAIKGREIEINGRKLERAIVPPENLDAIRHQIKGEVFSESNSGKSYPVMYSDNPPDSSATDEFKTIVPARSLFVLGDNRDRSRDSRHFGPVHAAEVIGYANYIIYPAETWSRFGTCND